MSSAQALGATAAKIRYSESEQTSCKFESGRLKDTEFHYSRGYAIEVLVGDRRGAASGNRLEDLDEMISRAVELAQIGSVAHFRAYPAPAAHARVRTYDEATAALSLDAMVAASGQIVEALRAYNPDLYIVAGAGRSVSRGALVTSGGVRHGVEGTSWALGGYAHRTEGNDMLSASFGRSWRGLNELFDPELIAKRIIEDLRKGETIVAAPLGDVPVFVDPEGLGLFLWPLTLGVSGRNVAKGDSPLRGRLGEQVLDPSLTIVDSPHVDLNPGAEELDADGVPTRRITIFDRGVLQCFLYDLDSAGLAGAAPTGNAGCAPYFLEVLPGERPAAELLGTIEDGLYIKHLIGFGQSNILNGDFSCNVGLGYRVRNGEVAGRVKNTMVAGNVYGILRQGVQLSADRDPALGLPSAILGGINVSAAQ